MRRRAIKSSFCWLEKYCSGGGWLLAGAGIKILRIRVLARPNYPRGVSWLLLTRHCLQFYCLLGHGEPRCHAAWWWSNELNHFNCCPQRCSTRAHASTAHCLCPVALCLQHWHWPRYLARHQTRVWRLNLARSCARIGWWNGEHPAAAMFLPTNGLPISCWLQQYEHCRPWPRIAQCQGYQYYCRAGGDTSHCAPAVTSVPCSRFQVLFLAPARIQFLLCAAG